MGIPTLYSSEKIAKYTEKGYWGSVTIADIWNRNARDYPDKEAVVDSKTRLTWAQAKQWTDRFALGLLELGLKKDEMIVLQLPICAELNLLRVACEKAGVLSLTTPGALRHKEIEYIIGKTEAVGIVITKEFHGFDYFEMVQEIRQQLPLLKNIFIVGKQVPQGTISIDEMVKQPLEEKYAPDYLEKTKFGALEYSWVHLTTGTTGFPKFVEAPICGRIYCGKAFAEACKLSMNDICGVFAVGPTGPNILANLGGPFVGAKIAMLERFEAGEALKFIEKEKVTITGIVPTMLSKMIEHPDFDNYDLSSLRAVLVTGSPLPTKLALEAEQKMGPLIQYYGSMDFGGSTVPHPDDPRETRLFTVNRLIPGNQIKFVDDMGSEVTRGEVGEIVLSGPASNSGYYKDAETTWQVWTKDGWFHTGDLGKLDDKENLVIVGRKKDMIIRGGQNIFPAEIESMLLDHPKVADVAIVSMSDEVMGEKACAYVVPKKGQHFTFEEMVDFLRGKNIAPYKLPERLENVEQLPLVPDSQKVNKKVLAQDIADKLKAEGNV